MTPANVGEGGLLVPTLRLCDQRWSWRPDYVVVDMGYLAAASKRICRERWQVAVLTHLRSDMKVVPPFETEQRTVCPQDQRLRWLGYDARAREQWFGAIQDDGLCASCWEQSRCPRQFVYPFGRTRDAVGKAATEHARRTVFVEESPTVDRADAVV